MAKGSLNPNRCWGVTKESVDDYLQKGKIVFPGDYDFHNLSVLPCRSLKDMGKDASCHRFSNQQSDELLKNMVNRGGTDEI